MGVSQAELLNCRQEVYQLTKELVGIPSIVKTEGEKAIAHHLYALLSSFPYFREHPEQVTLEQTIDDEWERYNVLAFVKGTKSASNRTFILMGHMDTVGVDDFNQHQEYAFGPDEWMDHLKHEDLPASAKEQLQSGDWLFGRGALDMKSGLASHLYLLKYYAKHPEQLEGNLVFVAECDEEDGSHGILSALKTLKRWKDEHDFDYVAAVNSDFVSPRAEEDENRYVYKGVAGKLLPTFLITGAETHVGDVFDGLDPNFVAAELTRQISYNPELSNEAFGETTVPPVALKQADLKPTYTVQTALSAYVYYNFFIHSWSPRQVLDKLKEQAHMAFTNALATFEERYRRYCEMSHRPYEEVHWQPRVFLFEEMEQMLIDTHGDSFIQHMDHFKQELLNDDALDTRMYAVRVVEEAWKWMEDQNPAIIVFYSSLYSPRFALSGETENERTLIRALEQAVKQVQPIYDHPIVVRNFFPYISDASFMALSDDKQGIAAIENNNPGWGTKHYVNYQDIRDIDVPVINIGPYGMDGHKRLERVEMTYSFEVVPNLTNMVMQKVLHDG